MNSDAHGLCVLCEVCVARCTVARKQSAAARQRNATQRNPMLSGTMGQLHSVLPRRATTDSHHRSSTPLHLAACPCCRLGRRRAAPRATQQRVTQGKRRQDAMPRACSRVHVHVHMLTRTHVSGPALPWPPDSHRLRHRWPVHLAAKNSQLSLVCTTQHAQHAQHAHVRHGPQQEQLSAARNLAGALEHAPAQQPRACRAAAASAAPANKHSVG